MNTKGKEFVVSVADFAFYVNDVLACTGTTNLSSSISVSMQEQAINAGKGNQKVFSYKYGRELTVELEAADWKLEYIAMQTGSQIEKGIKDFYKLNECITLTNGVGTLSETPIGKVGIELPNKTFVEVTATGTQIDLTRFGLGTGEVVVRATYQYRIMSKRITIDAESTPYIGKLVLQADKHNSKKGKIGTVEIVVPSYSLDGNFDISFTPDGVVSTKISGGALAVEGDTCADGNAVYAYVTEIDTTDAAGTDAYSEIVIVAPAKSVEAGGTIQLAVEGIIGAMYKPVELDASKVTFAATGTGAGEVAAATGIFTAGNSAGTATITATYGELTDTVEITVVAS